MHEIDRLEFLLYELSIDKVDKADFIREAMEIIAKLREKIK